MAQLVLLLAYIKQDSEIDHEARWTPSVYPSIAKR